ncbi:hypothetical protein G9C98_004740 [Cotesia typhae]|uniref:Uncharacterized protein n=1 Tax=Cotesia typhae TaxID=2053667 RepID=A0A8J5QWV8_9HYME|nr:hypothetical protein G9C98_004740 [Cotesia typhae]
MSEKASGLRQPSKIGRPCCTGPPKPAVPSPSPRSSMTIAELECFVNKPTCERHSIYFGQSIYLNVLEYTIYTVDVVVILL